MKQPEALAILKTGANVFLTGEPGSGKTYTINEYVKYLRAHGIDPAVTASTGIAATHIGGTTIHSWCGIGIQTKLDKYDLDRIASNKYVYARVERAKVLIIDEISMLGPETLSMVDEVCREIKKIPLPFGGLQVIFVGDFFQLPPVTKFGGNFESADLHLDIPKRFASESRVWEQASPIICYLTEQHRQEDETFLTILSAIRSNDFNESHLSHLAKRKVLSSHDLADVPKLFSHNFNVDRVNDESLNKLTSQPWVFTMSSKGRPAVVEVLKKNCLSPERLVLKLKAAVMFTKNNPREGYVNGTLGVVVGFSGGDENTGNPIVKTRNGEKIRVEPADWTIEDNGRVLAKITQLPLRLAWAITVHKSQGMSLDEAIMDLGQVFEFGQGYVALSRVRKLSGLHLLGWNARAFQVHPQILAADEDFRRASAEARATFARLPEAELSAMHKNFLKASGGSLEAIAEPKKRARKTKPKGETYLKTFELWNNGKSVAQIAQIRELGENTILAHVEKLYFDDKISEIDLNRLVDAQLASAIDSIQATFRELGTEQLSPVFEKFGGKYSYSQLRIARLLYKD